MQKIFTLGERLILGDKMPTLETIYIEYKEFCMKVPYLEFTKKKYRENEQAKYYVQSGFIPDSMYKYFEYNLYSYMEQYIPRYMSMFGNTKNIDYGTMYIGVGDDGEITGIPYEKSSLGYPKLLGWIEKIVEKTMLIYYKQEYKGIKDEIYEKYMTECHIKIHPLKMELDRLDESDQILNEKIQRLEEYNAHLHSIRQQYYIQKKEWIDSMEYYKKKISVMLNDPIIRKDVLDWLETLKQDDSVFDSRNYKQIYSEYFDRTKMKDEDVLKILPPQHVIDTIRDTKHFTLSPEYVKEHRYDVNHFIYWVLSFRDTKISQLMKLKPKHFEYQRCTLSYVSFLHQMRNMRKRWIENNRSRLKYYMIEIKIPCWNILQQIYEDSDIMIYHAPTQQVFHRDLDHHGHPTCRYV